MLAVLSVVGPSGVAPLRGAEPSPPAGHLFIDGDGPHAGRMGSSCIDSDSGFSCIDVPPPRRLQPNGMQGGDRLTLRLTDGWSFTSWHITYRRYAENGGAGTARRLSRGHADRGDERRSVSFTAPAAGDWWVTASVRFAGRQGRGDARYTWRLASTPDTAVAAGEPPSLALLVGAGAVPLTLLGGSFVLRRRARGRFTT